MPYNHLTPDECKSLLESIWQNSLNGYAIVDTNGKFRLANNAFCRLVEYTEAELQEMTFQDITIPTDIIADTAETKKVIHGEKESYDMTKTYITKGKKFLGIMLRVTAVRTNEKCIYLVKEVAPMDRVPMQQAMEDHIGVVKKRNTFLYYVRSYWVQILFGVGLFAYFVRVYRDNSGGL